MIALINENMHQRNYGGSNLLLMQVCVSLGLQEYTIMYGNYPNLHQAKTIDSVVYLKSDFS